MRRLLERLFLILAGAGLLLLLFCYWTAVSDPVVRNARIPVAGWPAGTPPLRLLLISDIHVGGPDMPPARLARIVEQINGLGSDLVLIAGDFITDRQVATRHYSLAEAVAPLAALAPKIGTFAVLGNHDHWRDAAEARVRLSAAGVIVLDNEAVQAGPLAIGGLDDAYTAHADVTRTVGQLRALPGARLLISHSPDPFPAVPRDVALMVAGHTHCGQIRLPLIGAVSTMSDYGDRYACGRIEEGGKVLVVSAGVGTSILPLRLLAGPDLWLIELRPAPAPEPRR